MCTRVLFPYSPGMERVPRLGTFLAQSAQSGLFQDSWVLLPATSFWAERGRSLNVASVAGDPIPTPCKWGSVFINDTILRLTRGLQVLNINLPWPVGGSSERVRKGAASVWSPALSRAATGSPRFRLFPTSHLGNHLQILNLPIHCQLTSNG